MRKILSHIANGIQFAAVVFGMLAVLNEFWIQRPKDRDLRNAQLHATVATLTASDNIEVTEVAVQKILTLMHKDGVDMTGISIPNVTFYMAAFEDIDWSDAYMNDVEFACTDRMYSLINNYDDENTARRLVPCAILKGATFSGTLMRRTRFNYADLSSSDLTEAVLDKARINDSVLSNSNFSRSDMSGVQIERSDFSGSNFGRSMTFDCWTIRDLECVRLRRVDLSSVEMPRVRLKGAEINYVDFSASNLERARIGCDEYQGKEICSNIEGVCLQDTNVSRARLEGVSISNTDLSVADISGTRFKNVSFENVVISDKQIDPKRFDKSSFKSLMRGRVDVLDLEADETPCTQLWRRKLTRWKEKFSLGL